MKTILSSCSARPNFVKLAAVHHAIMAVAGSHGSTSLTTGGSQLREIRHVIVHTGQHYGPLLSDVFFEQLEIPKPDENLGIKGGSDREEVIQKTAQAFMPVLHKYKPDIVLVYGDVNGAVGAARAAKEAGISIGHVEAGLRSFDFSMPEEHNRIEIDRLADYLFVTEQSGIDHLKEEGIRGRVEFVGNTMIDTLVRMMPLIEASQKRVRGMLSLPGPFALATIHRPSNVDDSRILGELMQFLSEVSRLCQVILPPHPRLKHALQRIGFDVSALQHLHVLEDPLEYLLFLGLMRESAFIITDSGGIQEEATFLRKRCFTLRKNTERPSTIESGANVLVDLEKEADRRQVFAYAENPTQISVTTPPKWDGKAGERIVSILSEL